MNPWKAVIDYLNGVLDGVPCLRTAQYFGIAEMVQKDDKRWPVCNIAGKGKDIIPDQRYPIQVFWMVDAGNSVNNDDEAYGENEKIMRGTLRMVAVGTPNAANKGCFNLQSDIEYLFLKSIPNTAFTASAGVYAVTIESSELVSGKQETLEKYWSGYEFQPKTLELFAFEIELEIRGVVCLTCDG